MAKYNPYRFQEEWLQLITECRQSGLADNTWCEAKQRPAKQLLQCRDQAQEERLCHSGNSCTI
ncbi:hypothetical protein [Lacrimispora sp.]|jgi:hypothetical protein|uniref:hypothetical protein n=1 Tax=Lacrimispora sp. TaxID=2719234 RepID=UPI0028AE654B|nr:hypothetical protein [Lacrimispora sp.]